MYPPQLRGSTTYSVVINDLNNGSELSLERSITDEDNTSDLDVSLEGTLRGLGLNRHTVGVGGMCCDSGMEGES